MPQVLALDHRGVGDRGGSRERYLGESVDGVAEMLEIICTAQCFDGCESSPQVGNHLFAQRHHAGGLYVRSSRAATHPSRKTAPTAGRAAGESRPGDLPKRTIEWAEFLVAHHNY
jgi:hypothetical protein